MALTKPTLAKNTAATETAAATEAAEQLTTQGVAATAVVEEAEAKKAADQPEQAEEAEEVKTTEATTAAVAELEEEVEAPKTQQVATQQDAKPPAAAGLSAGSMAQFTEMQAANGFEGLNITGMSFDRIKLHEGKFLIGSDESDLGTSFDCVVYGTRSIYVVRQSTDNDAEAYYSYDAAGTTFTDGTSAKEKLAEWLDDGYGTDDAPLDIRPYVEATVSLVNREDEYEGEMAILSIPPASSPRLGGCSAQAYMKCDKAMLNEVVTRCTVGKKIGEGQKAFRPWLFKVVGRYQG